MLKETLISIFERDLNRLKEEINLYVNHEDLWKKDRDINNSAGNLCLHILGSLNHFIGALLGNTGYVREREKEFTSSSKVEKMSSDIERTIVMIRQVISAIPEVDFNKNYPVPVLGKELTIGFFLVHLTTHLNYHLGQVNYHRRLLPM